MSHGIVLDTNYTSFSDDEKLNYGLKIALSRLQTELNRAWYQEPKDFAPKGPETLYKSTLPSYNELSSYYLIDPYCKVNGDDNVSMITDVTVGDILNNPNKQSGWEFSDISASARNNSTDILDISQPLSGVSKKMFTRYRYWENGLTGTKSDTDGSIVTGSDFTNSGTTPDTTEPENTILSYVNGSLSSTRTWKAYDDNFGEDNPENTFFTKLTTYSSPIKIISPDKINTNDYTDIKQAHPFIELYLQVPTISTRQSGDKANTSETGDANGTDNIGFFNPIMKQSLGDVEGFKYVIRGWAGNQARWGKLSIETGVTNNQNILYFLNNPGFILCYGVNDIVNGLNLSYKYPPVISFLKYTGETFADGIITQDISDNIPPPEVSNVKDLYIDTTNNLIYRLDQSGNEKSWVSVGGSGGAGGGASSDAVVKLETLETISRMGNEDSLVYQYTNSNELSKLGSNLPDIGVKQERLYNLDGTLSTTNTGYKWLSIHLHKDSSNNYYLNGSNYSEEISDLDNIRFIKLDEILRDNKLLDDDRITTLFNTASNNVVGFASVGMYGKKYIGDLKQQWNAFNNDWLKTDATSLSYASMRSNRHGCAYEYQTNKGIAIDVEQVDDDLRIMIGIYMENKNTDKSKLDGSMVIGKNYMTQYKPPVNGMLIEGNVGIGKTNPTTTLDVIGTITSDHIIATSTATIASVDINAGTIDDTVIGANSHTTGKFTTLEATTSATIESATIASVDINAGAIDGTEIGTTTRSSGKFTTLEANGNVTFNGGTQSMSNVDINAGTIDDTVIGANSHTTGKFTTLEATTSATIESATIASVDIDDGTIDGTEIGTTTRSSGKFTTLEADADVTFTGGTQSMSNVDIIGGTIDGTEIGTTTRSSGKFTTLEADADVTFTVGTQSMSNVDINGGTIDNTTIGTTTPSDASFVHVNITDTLDVDGNTRINSSLDVYGKMDQLGQSLTGVGSSDGTGSSVALSSDGTIVAVGEGRYDNYKGRVRVFQYNGSSWVQLGSHIYDATLNNIGSSVALSSDGTIVAVGAPGVVRVYQYINNSWSQLGNDFFVGPSVALSSDGTIVAIGASSHDSFKGLVRVFQYNGSSWVQLGTDFIGSSSSQLGSSVALSSDGTIVAIGAQTHGSSSSYKGLVRVFHYNGSSWVQLGSDFVGPANNDRMGSSVALSSDGTIVAIGAQTHGSSSSYKGLVRVYQYSGSSWVQLGSDFVGSVNSDYLGSSVALTSYGTIVAIGGRGDNLGKLTMYLYKNDSWVHIYQDDFVSESSTGSSVALSSDGTMVAVGAINTSKVRVYQSSSNMFVGNTRIQGNVGIGGTSTSDKLYVDGTITSTGNISSAGDALIQGNITTDVGYPYYQSLGTEKIVNPPSTAKTVHGVNITAMNKRTRASYASAVACVDTWTARLPIADNDNWYSVCWAPELSLFVAVGGLTIGSYTVMTSPDGIDWTVRSAAENNTWESVCWAPELSIFVAVASSGNGTKRVMTSPDGETWEGINVVENNEWKSVCWSPELSLFVAVASSGTNRVMTSPDGETWTTRNSSDDNNGWYSVCWAPELSLFVAVARFGTKQVMISADGETWEGINAASESVDTPDGWNSICWSPELSLFVAVAADSNNNHVMTSPDGKIWTIQDASENIKWHSVCWSPELSLFVAVGQQPDGLSGTNLVMTSPDGETWTTRNSSTDNKWYSVCWAPELSIFVAVALDGTNEQNTKVMTSAIGMPNSKSVVKALPSQMSVDASGNVSIGANLHINGDTTIGEGASMFTFKNATSGFLMQYGSGSAYAIGIMSNTDVYFYGAKIEGGKIGIGVTGTLSEKLEVNGNIKCTGNITSTNISGTNISGDITGNITSNYITTASITSNDSIYAQGRVAIGTTSYPKYPLYVYDGNNELDGETIQSYLRPRTNASVGGSSNSWLGVYEKISIGAEHGIFSLQGYVGASDERIKKNIIEINDSVALQKLRDISCCWYNYKDHVERGDVRVLGFIAQQVKDHLPEAVGFQKHVIPNEMRELTTIGWEKITDTSNNVSYKLTTDLQDVSGVNYRFYVSNDPSGNDECEKEVIGNSDNTFTFDQSYNQVFCYGKEVDDFHTLNKQKLFALNFSATQEIDRQQQLDKARITELSIQQQMDKARISELESQLSSVMSRLMELEGRK